MSKQQNKEKQTYNSYDEIVRRAQEYCKSDEFNRNIERSKEFSITIRKESCIGEDVLSKPITI